MKRLRLPLLCLPLLLAASFSTATEFSFFYISGEVYVINGNTRSTAISGIVIAPHESVQLGEKGYAVIARNGSEAIILDMPGIYSVPDIAVMFTKNRESISSRFFSYLVAEMFGHGNTEGEHIPGGVERAGVLMRFPPDSSLLLSKNISFRWLLSEPGSPLYFTLRNSMDETVAHTARYDSSCSVTIEQPTQGDYYTWIVSSHPMATEPVYTFTLAGDAQIKEIGKEISFIQSLPVNDPMITTLLLVALYDMHRLYGEEYLLLQKATGEFPGDLMLQQLYHAFNQRHGL